MPRKKTVYPKQEETLTAPKPKRKPRKLGVTKPPAPVVKEAPRWKPPPAPKDPQPATQHVFKPTPLPSLSDVSYNWMEIPRALVRLDGVDLFYETDGEADRKKIVLFKLFLDQGYKIHSMQPTNRNSFLFVFEKGK